MFFSMLVERFDGHAFSGSRFGKLHNQWAGILIIKFVRAVEISLGAVKVLDCQRDLLRQAAWSLRLLTVEQGVCRVQQQTQGMNWPKAFSKLLRTGGQDRFTGWILFGPFERNGSRGHYIPYKACIVLVEI
jgi:hypothetical protein